MQVGNKQRLFIHGNTNVSFPVEERQQGQGYYTNKQNSKYGLVLLQQWWDLINLILTANKIAQGGYQILIPDLYRGKTAKDTEEAGHLLSGLDWTGALADIKGAKQFLQKNGAQKVGIMGFCMGGALSIAAATLNQDFDAVAPFYGIPDLNNFDVYKITSRFQAHFGQLDQLQGFSDLQSAQKMMQKIKTTHPSANLIVYKGAKHAFMNIDYENYNAEAYKQAIERIQVFFK